jgi:hypothetical protein
VTNSTADFSTSLNTTESNSNITIFDVQIANTSVDSYFKLSNTTDTEPKGSIRDDNLATFLANNDDPNVLQIALVGERLSDYVKPKQPAQTTGLTLYYRGADFDPFENFMINGTLVVNPNSQFDYIVSLNDTDNLTENHTLIFSPEGKLTDTLPLQSGLYGLALFPGVNHIYPRYNNGNDASHDPLYNNLDFYITEPNALGLTLAHEVGHVLSLRHRAGGASSGAPFDDMENQTNDAGAPLIFLPNTNLMNQSDLFGRNLPEDIDLHQALVMRNHVGNLTVGNTTITPLLHP